MKKIFISGCLVFICIFITGCSNNDVENKTQVITATIGETKATFPEDWTEETKSLGTQGIVIAMLSREEDAGLSIAVESLLDFDGPIPLNRYVELYTEMLLPSMLSNVEISDVESVRLDNNDAVKFIATGSSSSIKTKYLFIITKTGSNFYIVSGRTRPSSYADYEATFNDIINSIQLGE